MLYEFSDPWDLCAAALGFPMNMLNEPEGWSEFSDPLLLAEVSRGNADAFKALFDRYYPRLTNLAVRYCGDRVIARDTVVGFFSDLWISRHLLCSVRYPATYLARSLVRKLGLARRQERNRQRKEYSYWCATADQPAQDPLVSRELEHFLAALVNKLPEQKRKIMLLKKDMGLRHDEIGAMLGISALTVRNHLHEAVKILRKQLRGVQHQYV